MTFGFALLTVGTLLAISAYKNISIAEVMQGLKVTRRGPGESGFVSVLTGAGDALTPRSGGEGLSLPGGRGNPTQKERELKRQFPALRPGVLTVAAVMLTLFPGLTVTSHYRPGDDGHHGEGRAVDLSGSSAEMRRAAHWAQTHIRKVLQEGIHNPGLSVEGGKTVPVSHWGSDWAAHSDHLHLAV